MLFGKNKIIFLNIKFCQQVFILGKEKKKKLHTQKVGNIPVNTFFLCEDFHLISAMFSMLFPSYWNHIPVCHAKSQNQALKKLFQEQFNFFTEKHKPEKFCVSDGWTHKIKIIKCHAIC